MEIDTNYVQNVCELLKHMSNEVRYAILVCLNEKPLSVMELNRRIPVSQSALSQHLKMLRLAKLINARKIGTSVEYKLISPHVGQVIQTLGQLYKATPYRVDLRTDGPTILHEPSYQK